MRNKDRKTLILSIFLIMAVWFVTACQASQTETVNSPEAIAATSTRLPSPIPPDELPEPTRTLEDTDASLRAKEKRALTGDNFFEGLFERPFTSKEMLYLEDVDIRIVNIAQDDVFYFFTIELRGLDADTNNLTGSYGIEFDRSKTGRGDLLIWATDIKKEWSMDGVKVFSDPDQTVGGPTPMWADKEYDKAGYEKEEKLEGERAAYARVDPMDATIVQFAISKALLGNTKEFLWGAWADKGWQDPLRFDYNDHILEPDAGSPIKTSKYYPVKELASLDNTCRVPEGFTTKESIRGMCANLQCHYVTMCNRNKVCQRRLVCT